MGRHELVRQKSRILLIGGGFVLWVLLLRSLAPVSEEAEDAPHALALLLRVTLVVLLLVLLRFILVLGLLLQVDHRFVTTAILFAQNCLLIRGIGQHRIRSLILLLGL